MYTKEDNPLYYYCSILGISSQAMPEEIKKAWYKKSLKLHPDKNPGIDTTEAMQELNQAYEFLSARASKNEKGADFQFFSSGNKQKKSKAYGSLGIFQFEGGWSVKIDGGGIFIDHPTLRGCKNGITISQYKNRQFISLPLNYNDALRNRLWRQLMSISRDYELEYWGAVELCFVLPENQSIWYDIFSCIFRAYKSPLPFSKFVVELLRLPPSDQKKSISEFYSHPGMHYHDKWKANLTGMHLFLTHPEITKTAPLTFFNMFEPQFYITLPVNNNQSSFKFFNEKLLPLICENPIVNNLYEIVVKLDKSEYPDDVLECIFDFYDIPERIAKPIRQECRASVTVDSDRTRSWGI